MGKKKGFALRIDEDLLNAIEKWAADEFRSTNGQIEWVITHALRRTGRLKKENNNENSLENNENLPEESNQKNIQNNDSTQ